jgi:serine/threonine-protein kinase
MFQMVSQLIPESTIGYKNTGGVHLLLGQYGEAEKALQRSIEIAPSAEAYSNLSVIATFQGRHRDAVKWLEKAVAIGPGNDQTWRNLGDAYLQLPERAGEAPAAYRKALEAVQQRLRVDPTRPDLLLSSALYYAKLRMGAQAVQALQQAQARGPLNAAQTFKAAVVWELLNERDRALKALREAMQRGYSKEQIEKEPELESLRKDPRYSLTR